MLTLNSKPTYNLENVQSLLDVYTRLVLLEPWGRLKPDGSQVKKPAHRGWRTQHPPGFPLTSSHVSQDGLLGVVPASLAAVVMDVDRGDATALIGEFPPWFVARSQKPGRFHLWYLNPSGLKPPAKRWIGPGGTGGEAIYDFPYAVMWENSLELLAEAVADLNEDREGTFTDFSLVAQGITWELKPTRAGTGNAGKATGRHRPDKAPDLTNTPPGKRDDDVFDWLGVWADSHWRHYSTFDDLHLELQRLARVAYSLLPDYGPSPNDGDQYTEAEALTTARSVATGVWEYQVTGKRKRAEIGYFPDSDQKFSARRDDSRPFSRRGQSWDSIDTQPEETGNTHTRAGGLGELGYRGDPALNADSEVQSYRRGCRTRRDQPRLEHRRRVVATRFAAGQPVATLTSVFGVTARTIRRDLASVGELPSKRSARRKLQADRERARRATAGRQGRLGTGDLPGRIGTAGTLQNNRERLAGVEDNQERDSLGQPPKTPTPPPTPNQEGSAKAPPPEYGLVSGSGQARDGPAENRAFQARCPHTSRVTRAKNLGDNRIDVQECRSCHINLRWGNAMPQGKYPNRDYFNLGRSYPKVVMSGGLLAQGFTRGTIEKYLGPPDELGVSPDDTDTDIRLWYVGRVQETIHSNVELRQVLKHRKESRQHRKEQAGSRTPKAQEG